VPRDHRRVVRGVAARHLEREAAAPRVAVPVSSLPNHRRRLLVVVSRARGPAVVVADRLLPAVLARPLRGGGGGERALDAAASGHAPAGSGGVPLVRGLRDDGTAARCQRAAGTARGRQSPQLQDVGLPDLLLQLPRQLARVHAVADQQQHVPALAGHRHRLDP